MQQKTSAGGSFQTMWTKSIIKGMFLKETLIWLHGHCPNICVYVVCIYIYLYMHTHKPTHTYIYYSSQIKFITCRRKATLPVYGIVLL